MSLDLEVNYNRNNNNGLDSNTNNNTDDSNTNTTLHQRYGHTVPDAGRSRNTAAEEMIIRRAALIGRQQSRTNISRARSLSPECAIPHQYRPKNWSRADLVPHFPSGDNSTVATSLTEVNIRESLEVIERDNDDKKLDEPNANKSKQ